MPGHSKYSKYIGYDYHSPVFRHYNTWSQKGTPDLFMMVPSSSVSPGTLDMSLAAQGTKSNPRLDLSMFSVSCGLMVNIEMQQSMTAVSGLYSALKQFPFLYVHLHQFV